MENILTCEQNCFVFAGNPGFGRKLMAPIPSDCMRRGGEMYLHIELPELDEHHRWVPYIGEAIISKISYEMNDNRIDQHDGHYLHAYSALNLSSDEQKVYHRMIGHRPELYNKSYIDDDNHVKWRKSDKTSIMVPLRFAFSKYKECRLSLESPVRIILELEIARSLIQCKSDCQFHDEAVAHYPNIDECYIVWNLYAPLGTPSYDTPSYGPVAMDTVQFTGTEAIHLGKSPHHKIRLGFESHVKELIFMVKDPDRIHMKSPNDIEDLNDAPCTLAVTNDCIDQIGLKINDRFAIPMLSADYYTDIQQLEHHVNNDSAVYCYSFVNDPESPLFSLSAINFSKIENATLCLSLKDTSKKYAKDICLTKEQLALLDQLDVSVRESVIDNIRERIPQEPLELRVYAISYVPLIVKDGTTCTEGEVSKASEAEESFSNIAVTKI